MNELIMLLEDKYKPEELMEILFNNSLLPDILTSEVKMKNRKSGFCSILNLYNIAIANTPFEAEIHFTERCNLKCKHCAYSCSNNSSRHELEYDVWIDLFDQFEEVDILRVIISGGEPFLYKDIQYLLSDLSKRKFRIDILTNGLLIKKEHFHFLKNPHISLSLSLDSVIKEHHEYLRGANTFEKVIENIKELNDNEIRFGISTTIHKQNMNDLEGLIIFAYQNRASFISFILLDEVGRAEENKVIHLNKEDVEWLSSRLRELQSKYIHYISISFLDPVKPSFKYDQKKYYPNQIFCTGGTIRCAIASDGQMYPCVYGFELCDTSAGSITKERLNSLWNTNLWDEFRGKINITDLEKCPKCKFVSSCYLKNCRLRAKLYGKNILAVPHNCPQAEVL